MSKIGKINISIPEKVKVVLNGNILNVEGPLGKRSLNMDLEMFDLKINDGKEVTIKPKKIDQNTKRLWGMNRSLINNAIIVVETLIKKFQLNMPETLTIELSGTRTEAIKNRLNILISNGVVGLILVLFFLFLFLK